MIDKININPIRDQVEGPSSGQANRSKRAPNGQADATLQINFDRLIEQANKIPAEDAVAVQKARQLLESGQLDTPANIKEAAENIIKFGV